MYNQQQLQQMQQMQAQQQQMQQAQPQQQMQQMQQQPQMQQQAQYTPQQIAAYYQQQQMLAVQQQQQQQVSQVAAQGNAATGMVQIPGQQMAGQQTAQTGMAGMIGNTTPVNVNAAQQAVGAGAQAGGMGNMQAMANNPMAMQQMQLMYQQYAMRLAAYQRFAQASNGAGQGNMGGMGAGYDNGMGYGMGAGYEGGGGMQGMGGGGGGGMNGGGGGGGGGGMGGGQGGGEQRGSFWKTRICNKWREGGCPFAETCRYAHGDQELRPDSTGGGGGGGGGFQANRGGMGMGMGGGRNMQGQQGQAGQAQRQMEIGGVPVDKRTMIELMKKTRICEEFMQTGACRYGDRCTFAHGHQEMRQPPTTPQLHAQLQELQKGGRPAGGFSGGGANFVGLPGGKDTMRKTRLCERFVTTGMCPYGDKCTFAHGQDEMRIRPPGGFPVAGAAAAVKPEGGPRPTIGPQLAPAGASASQAQFGNDASVVGEKRRAEGGEESSGVAADDAIKRQHTEEEAPVVLPECPLCARLVSMGKNKVTEAVNALENIKAKNLGLIVLSASPRLDQLWSRCNQATMLGWMGKAELPIMDKVELLKAVVYHQHGGEEERANLESQKYVALGLPPQVADFVYTAMEGKEAVASMSDYFHLLEVLKTVYGVDDEQYFNVSTAVARIMMGM